MRMFCAIAALFLVFGVTLTAQDEDVLRPHGRPVDANAEPARKSKTKARVTLGIEAGLNINFMSTPMTSTPEIPNSSEFTLESGMGISPEFGVFADFPMSDVFGIQARIAYDPKVAGNTGGGKVIANRKDEFGNVIEFVDTDVETEYNLTTQNAAIALLARFDVMKNLFITIGPYMTLAVADAVREDRLTVISPEDINIEVDYAGNPITAKEIRRETDTAMNLLPQAFGAVYSGSTYAGGRIGIELGVGYRIELTKSMYLAPNIRYQYMITELTTNFQATDISRGAVQELGLIDYDKSSLNSLAIILQLGFNL